MNGATTTSIAHQRELLEAAQGGDAQAFGRLVEPYRAELQAHCYRILGSAHDAEDALQDALLRAWRGLGRFQGRSPLRTWLYTIATNTCLSLIARRPRRMLPSDFGPPWDPHRGHGDPLVESGWVEPYASDSPGLDDGFAAPEARYELRESVELAFIVALQHLPPRQRAVLILREVLGFSAGEVAEMLDATPAAVYSVLQRAHKAVNARLPEQSQQATLRSLGDARLRVLVDSYVEAWERGDVGALLALLTENVTFAMPPRPTWYRGRESVGAFLAAWPLSPEQRWRLVGVGANGQVAFGTYAWNAETKSYLPHAIDVLTLHGDQIDQITAFVGSGDFRRFELPDAIQP